jgi:N-methylhydantoinase A/oxoprolinase/acetone carboxylase beta subunit
LLERENATLLNAALTKLARVVVAGLHNAIASAGLKARLFLSQNDGTMISAEAAQHRPIFCFTSGPTNSMRGAAQLSGIADGIVIDVGGTTADVGALQAGFPREANSVVEVAGVRTLFRMPDTLSVAIGGGSRVHSNPLRIGPDSVAYHITRDALIFGGDQLTATDVAVALGWVKLGNVERVQHIDRGVADAFTASVRNRLEEAVDRLKMRAHAVPVVAVGGASFLIPAKLSGVSEVIHVEHHDVANAVGAANAKVGGEVDQVFRDVARDAAIERATELALARAVQAGAKPGSVKIVEKEDLPLSYVSGNTRRIRIRAAGDFA